MAEMPDVVTGTTISSDWGNDIRDRTVQRYASVAARSAAIPAPVEGDLSYLQDSNSVWVHNGSAWVELAPVPVEGVDAAGSFLPSFIVTAADTAASADITTSLVAYCTATLSIPAGWGSWNCVAMASGVLIGTNGQCDYDLRVDGTDLQAVSLTWSATADNKTLSVVGRRTGMTSTGSRTVNLMIVANVSTIDLVDATLVAMALRQT